MTGGRARYALETPGARLTLHGGLLLGRSLDCDVVIPDEQVSRHHAIVRATDGGVEVVPLSGPVALNGAPVGAATALSVGDELDLHGRRFVLRHAAEAPPEQETLWFVERDRGLLVSIGDERFTVGGGDDDRLVIAGWERCAIALERVGEHVVAEVFVDGVTLDRARQPGDIVTVASGSSVVHRGASFRVLALPADPSKPTRRPAFDEAITEASLTFLPRGGRLAVTAGARTLRLYLAEKRCDFIACLLQPPKPYEVGAPVPDEVIAARLWPGGRGGRTDINTLIWRLRKDIAAAGFDGLSLLDRAAGGVSLRLAPGARVSVA